MLDDGGCNNAVADNSSSSYDENLADSMYSYGFRDPSVGKVGDYYLHYQNIQSGNRIHIQVDNIAAITKLSRVIYLKTPGPTGQSNNTIVAPTFTWNSIAGANYYRVSVDNAQNSTTYNNYQGCPGPSVSCDPARNTSATSYAVTNPTNNLLDDAIYRVQITAFDTNIITTPDFDASVRGMNSYFAQDTASDSTITISGTLTNNTNLDPGNNKFYIIEGTGDNGDSFTHANVVLPTTTTNYTLVVAKNTGATDKGEITFTFDVEDSGSTNSNSSNNLREKYSELNSQAANITQNQKFNQPMVIGAPLEGASAVGNNPTFTWESYSTTVTNAGTTGPAGAFSYVVWYTANNTGGSGGFPSAIWGLPNTSTSLSLSSFPVHPNKYDVTCIASNQPISVWDGPNSACINGTSSLSDLSSTGDWQWGVITVECNYNDYVNNVDANVNGINDYQECVLATLSTSGNGFSSKEEVKFTTF